MDSDDTMDDRARHLMHKTNDEIRIGENAKVTQHYRYFEDANVCDDEDHLEAPHRPILAVNFVKTIIVFVREEVQLKVVQGLGLALHLPHLTATFQNTKEYSIVVIK